MPTRKYLYSILTLATLNRIQLTIPKEVTKQKESRFSYYFCLVNEGSGSGSIPLTNGSGSGRAQKHVDLVDLKNCEKCSSNIRH
jgi:hypothetical protein